MTPQHRNPFTLLDPFWDSTIHKKVTRTIIQGGPETDPKTGPHSGSQNSDILQLFITLEQGQTSQKWTPFWERFEDQFCIKYGNKNEETEDTKK